LQFKAWDGPNGHLPVFKKDPKLGLAKGPRAHIMAITKRWLAPDGDPTKGIDGWRLDVPGDIPHPFWIDWHKVVRAAKPDAYISGEIWTWAQPWLNNGDQFDAVMNYRFAEPVQQFFVNQKTAISPSTFNARLVELEMNYPLQVAQVQQNLFDSHDTDRAASMYVNPDRPYDGQNRIQDNAADIGYDPRKPNDTERARFRQAVAFQMSFLGAPMIYYGDEAGMWGPDDPSNRQPMIWKDLQPYDDPQVKFDQSLFDCYQRAIAVRAALPALQTGFYHPLLIDDSRGVIAFARDLDRTSVIVVINRSNGEQSVDVPVDAKGEIGLIDWMSPDSVGITQSSDKPDARPIASLKTDATPIMARDGKLAVELQPYQTMILSAK
jgi:glycosidase